MSALKALVESSRFQNFIIAVIVINAITLGLETSPTVMAAAGSALVMLDRVALAIFVLEIVLKLVVYRHNFFRSGWNVFDFLIVGVTLLPVGEGVSVLRALRILRALRLISVVPSMRKVVNALLRAIPGMSSVLTLLLLVFYVAAVMATKLFATDFPEWFGSIGASFYTLFQVMTLESWSMGIVRPVMEVHPLAWLFFVVFILTTTFAVLNLFIAIVVDAMNTSDHAEQEETRELVVTEHELVMAELKALRTELAELRAERGGAAPASGDQALASRL
ncbi:ion transporter [Thauera mechernichensis]|uniref:Ion transporter n=1 Tax=Thauera mechernichensis TaxID=82788 RepID=A0ABW3WG06_9RHOO|nr:MULTISPECIES: ion transporter [Thauera]MDG3064937.1 ion transporter [Thauera mechernichensis]HNS93031.1 ion transporter [Thauera sp.]